MRLVKRPPEFQASNALAKLGVGLALPPSEHKDAGRDTWGYWDRVFNEPLPELLNEPIPQGAIPSDVLETWAPHFGRGPFGRGGCFYIEGTREGDKWRFRVVIALTLAVELGWRP